MSLRLRLVLAFMAIVSLMVAVGAISFRINRQIRTQVAQLGSRSIVGWEAADVEETALEVEGYWHKSGAFVATHVERLPGPRRPKLRGEIQRVDMTTNRIWVYGVPIAITERTDAADDGEEAVHFAAFQVGQRVEVSCAVNETGLWRARKVKVRNVKSSDKVKGTITRARVDGVLPDTLEISGLVIAVVSRKTDSNPSAHLHRIHKATQMTLAIQECRAAAYDLLDRLRSGDIGTEEAVDDEADSGQEAEALIVQAQQDFKYYLGESRIAASGDRSSSGVESAGGESDQVNLWLGPLAEKQDAFEADVSQFLELATVDPDEAREFLSTVLEPFMQNEMLPLIHNYRMDVEEELADEVRAISSRAETTTLLIGASSIAAVLLALVLGFLVWRSISKPVLALNAAATNIGRGQLETRVDISSTDELGTLAGAFNRMAEELAAHTVSVSNLNSVIDSMAGSLIIINKNGQITSVNRAASVMLGYSEEELIGRPFTAVCPPGERDAAAPTVEPTKEGIVAIEEKVFRRKDGTALPVSFSGAALRSGAGPSLGFVCVAQDLSDRKRMEEQLRRSLAEKELLFREVHHRVKNNLQVISSLLDLQSSYIADSQTLEQFQESQNRVRTMALIHEQLYRTTEFGEIDFRAYLEQLGQYLFHSHGFHGDSIKLRLDVAELTLDIDQAVACGLIVNELVTNALKHAFQNRVEGEIIVTFKLGNNDDHILAVADNGSGIDDGFSIEDSDTLGMSLVSTLAQQLRGRLFVRSKGGTEFRIEFPAQTAEKEPSST